MEYDFQSIESKWQQRWRASQLYKVVEDPSKPKFYALDMFPYPSGSGLHVGHPLGYIASDVIARYKRHCGYNVLHPMGYDSFGLPAEQYAIQTGLHPAITTERNILRYREQLDRIGFSFDWNREVRTSDPDYYRWTQWIFGQIFQSWYNLDTNRAEPIANLISKFNENGTYSVRAFVEENWYQSLDLSKFHFGKNFEGDFTATDWKSLNPEQQELILMHFRLAFIADSMVNWCPELGTVLANDEIKDGKSERGGHPVVQLKMRQWSMRITAYAQRLLEGLDQIDWPENIKEVQRNWIGQSFGASVYFQVAGHHETIEVFTTRPDTIFGVSFMTLAPEHELVRKITTEPYRSAIDEYIAKTQLKTERDRQADAKNISGQFTGAYAIHPFSGEKIPIWISEYVLSGYGTGAVMAVPAGDTRDWNFAKKFDLPIPAIFEGIDTNEKAEPSKDVILTQSDFLNGLSSKEAWIKVIETLESTGCGKAKTNYRMRDAVFSRQRYWGEPFPIYYKNEIPYLLDEKDGQVTLPEVDKYLPTADGEPPLARAKKEDWSVWKADRMEYNTMPGWAGSSWYFLRYMDAHNNQTFADRDKTDYWNQVDLYIGGAEHATGHLLYARFWTKILFDLGYIGFEEPFKKLINQGMILGRSNHVYRIEGTQTFVSADKKEAYNTQQLYVDINLVNNDILDIEAFKKWLPEYENAQFILNDQGQYVCTWAIDKMSKRWFNVANPDELCEKFGADTLRLYEMFLGPVEQHKPWDTKGINGVHNFLRKYWRLSHDKNNQWNVTSTEPTAAELKVLHTAIKKVTEELNRLSWNTVVSTLMIAVNELTELKCNNREVLKSLSILLSPYAPHIAEEIWEKLTDGLEGSITQAAWPIANEQYLVESEFEYPVSFNGKTRFFLPLPTNMEASQIESIVRAHENTQKHLDGKPIKKIIIVPKRIINVVI